LQAKPVQFGQYKIVDLVAHPFGVFWLGKGRFGGRGEGPMPFVAGPLADPLFEKTDLLRGEGAQVGVCRWHFKAGIVRRYAFEQHGTVGMTGDDGEGTLCVM